ncbi:MAG TPA: membrane protein insertion efficiency factor YidD [Coxiellaceae bacterium]|nr:membrane protein insertion efficiency factor YidD [Coxiellaceae bacterium]
MPRCRFYPSCSEYAHDAFSSHSITKALYLTGKRLLRCHPFNRGGYDPVPQSLKRETHGF